MRGIQACSFKADRKGFEIKALFEDGQELERDVPRVRFEIQLETEASELKPSPLESDSEEEQLLLSRTGLLEFKERKASEFSIVSVSSLEKDLRQDWFKFRFEARIARSPVLVEEGR